MDEKNGMYAVDGTTGYSINQMNYATVEKSYYDNFLYQRGLQPAYMNFQHYKKLLRVNTEKVIWPVGRSLAGQLLSPVPAPWVPAAPALDTQGRRVSAGEEPWNQPCAHTMAIQRAGDLKSFIHSLVLQ